MGGKLYVCTETGKGQKGDIKIKQNRDKEVLKKKGKRWGKMMKGKERVSMGLCKHAYKL